MLPPPHAVRNTNAVMARRSVRILIAVSSVELPANPVIVMKSGGYVWAIGHITEDSARAGESDLIHRRTTLELLKTPHGQPKAASEVISEATSQPAGIAGRLLLIEAVQAVLRRVTSRDSRHERTYRRRVGNPGD